LERTVQQVHKIKENARRGTIKAGFYRRLPDPEDKGIMTLQNNHNYLAQQTQPHIPSYSTVRTSNLTTSSNDLPTSYKTVSLLQKYLLDFSFFCFLFFFFSFFFFLFFFVSDAVSESESVEELLLLLLTGFFFTLLSEKKFRFFHHKHKIKTQRNQSDVFLQDYNSSGLTTAHPTYRMLIMLPPNKCISHIQLTNTITELFETYGKICFILPENAMHFIPLSSLVHYILILYVKGALKFKCPALVPENTLLLTLSGWPSESHR